LPTSIEQLISERDEFHCPATPPASGGSSPPAEAIIAQLRAISAASIIGVAIVAVDETFTWVNAALAALLGRRADELDGRTFADVTHPDDLHFDAKLAGLLFAGTLDTYQMRKRYVRADGGVVPALLTASLLRGPNREILLALATIEPSPPPPNAEHADSGHRLTRAFATPREMPADDGPNEVDRIRRAMLE
jgi:PAS domain S-box-containing protein